MPTFKKGQIYLLQDHLEVKDQAVYTYKGGASPEFVYFDAESGMPMRMSGIPASDKELATAIPSTPDRLHPKIAALFSLDKVPAEPVVKGGIYTAEKDLRLEGGRTASVGERLLCVKGGKKPEFLINKDFCFSPSINVSMRLILSPGMVSPAKSAMESPLKDLRAVTKTWNTYDGGGSETKISGSLLQNPIIYLDQGDGGPPRIMGDRSDIETLGTLMESVLDASDLVSPDEVSQICSAKRLDSELGALSLLAEYLNDNGGISSFTEQVRHTLDTFPTLFLDQPHKDGKALNKDAPTP